MKIPNVSFQQNLLLVILISLIQIAIIHFSPSPYISTFFILIFSFVGGVLENRKGFILAIIQIVIIISGYWTLQLLNFIPTKPDVAIFASHVSIFPTLAGSFLGSFIRKI